MSARAPLPAVLLALLCVVGAVALLRMAPAWSPSRIQVALAPGSAVELGRAELAAPGIPAQALRLGRDAAGRWWAAGSGTAGALRFERAGKKTPAASLALRPGMRFGLGAAAYVVEQAPAGASQSEPGNALHFSDGRHAWRYDGATLWRDGTPLPPCPRTGLATHLAGLWNRWAPAALTLARPLRFGGSLDCGTRIGNAHALQGSATLTLERDRALLTASTGPSRVPVMVEDGEGNGARDLALRATPLADVDAIGIGRTRLRLLRQGDTLVLAPGGRVAQFGAPQAALPAGVGWTWTSRAPWALPAAAPLWALLALAAGALAAFLAWRARPARTRDLPAALGSGAGLALATLGLGMLLGARSAQAIGAASAHLLACLALAYGMACALRTSATNGGRLLAGAVLLLAAGLLLQLELGLGAPDTGWLRHFLKTAGVTVLGLGLLGWVSPWLRRGAPAQGRVETALLALAALALAGLLIQVGWGDETGVFELQPVEFAKLALLLLNAHCLALGLGAGPGRGLARALRLAAPVLLFGMLLALALVQVDDYSPLILLLVWGAATLLAWAWTGARRRPAALTALAAGAGLGVAALLLLRGLGPDEVAQWRFYGERFGVWLDPATHPHTGAQLLRAAEAIADGGWFGADGAFGLAALGQDAGAALAIPAVQDDFAPAFLLQRHGLAGALALWTLQALFLCALLRAAAGAWRAGGRARHHRGAWFGRWRCFVLCGGAAFLSGHFLLSWGTNLAFFPVMGQPMSFLSAGGSHLLLFIFPLLAVAIAGEPSSEEI